MKTVTCFIADDGSEHPTDEQAVARELLILAVDGATRPLGPPYRDERDCGYQNGRGFVRHDPAAVLETRRRLLGLTRKYLGKWMREQETIHHSDLMKAHPDWFLRLLDGSAPPLESAWSRLLCIDPEGREWGQPYFVTHPHEAESFEIERVTP